MQISFLVFICLLYKPATSQTFDTPPENCLSLQNSNASLRSYVSSPEFLMPMNCFNDDNMTIPYPRYSLSRLCAGLIQDSDYSLPCNYHFHMTPPPLCQSTCNDWYNSVAEISESEQLCPDRTARQDGLEYFASSCASWSGFNGSAGYCISGKTNEPDNCGFQNDTTGACLYCQENGDDVCCKQVACSSNLSTGAIVGIVIGCLVAGALIAGAFFWFCCRRKRVRQNRFSFRTYIPPFNQPASHGFNTNISGFSDSVASRQALVTHGNAANDNGTHEEQSNFMDVGAHPPEESSAEPEKSLTQIEELFEVVHPYPPQMGDELGLHVGDIVCLAMQFDDGWALGFNVTTGSQGVFPLVCVVPASEELQERLLQPGVADDRGYSNKILIEDDSLPYQSPPPSSPNHVALTMQRIREDMRRSLSVHSSMRRTPSPGPTSSPPTPLPRSEMTNHSTIPRRTASIMRSSYGYAEIDSPTSPTTNTPFFDVPIPTDTTTSAAPYYDAPKSPAAPYFDATMLSNTAEPSSMSPVSRTPEAYEMFHQHNRVSKHAVVDDR
ncbi:uncharacterized protein BYT42DRAFT_356624 [Radiomyces spectabilis]|uniref:uncharacterized protein n=1 Tax=Radiomyces spectabilis TaxID=64574 RepID=UPI002220EFAC|nr:uncharacterized protein BYT42DRAFT_356624 [Radiomyces spectabilis]KAI8377759.1 hypothetical protein BYT42DRAFT_356624 [Radiomyces spectabilis]